MRQFSRILAHNNLVIELFGVDFEKVCTYVTMQCRVQYDQTMRYQKLLLVQGHYLGMIYSGSWRVGLTKGNKSF